MTSDLGPYKRKIKDLSKEEIYVIGKGKSLGVSKEHTREQNTKLILIANPGFADNLDQYQFFTHQMFEGRKILGHITDPKDQHKIFTEKKAAPGFKINFAEIKKSLANENPEPIEEDSGLISSNQSFMAENGPLPTSPLSQITHVENKFEFTQAAIIEQENKDIRDKFRELENRISSKLKQTMTKLQAEIQSQFRLFKNVGDSAQRARGYRPVQKTPKRRLPKELYDALEGNCIQHLTSTCSFTPCKYKHEQISQVSRSVIAAAQQYSNTN